MTASRFSRIPRSLRWLLGVIAVLALLTACLALMDWNAARGPLSRMLSRHIQRPVAIGHLSVHLFSFSPSVELTDLTIGNPEWTGGGNMIELPHLQVAAVLADLLLGRLVLQTLDLDTPKVALLRNPSGRANWDFGSGERTPKSQQRMQLPPVRHFAMRGGSLEIHDAIRKLSFAGTVSASERKRDSEQNEPFRLEGQGTLNAEPFKLVFQGSALRAIRLDEPYEFDSTVDAGASRVKVKGSLARPFDLAHIDADVELQGQNLANLYDLTRLALPLTPPYRVAVHVHRDGNHFAFESIAGKIGNSDIRGKGSVELADADARPRLTASIISHSLSLSDLGVAVGARVPQPGQSVKTPAPIEAPKQSPISPLLLPTFQFQFDRLQAMDATVDFLADSVQAQKVPIKNVQFRLTLDHGELRIDPLDFQLPEGKLAGTIHLSTKGTPRAQMDLRLSDVRLDQFKPKNSDDAPLKGVMQGRLRIDGSGNSVHAIAASANGTVSAVISQAQIREAFAELAGIDVVRGLGLLLTKKNQTVPIRCGVAEFQLQNGDAQAQQLLVDTPDVLVTGDGKIALADEKLDLNLKGDPKKPRFDRLRAPINIRGTLRHPSFSLSTPALAKQGAAAAVLGAVATPFAALLAFIDPGLAKNADCAQLTSEAATKVSEAPTNGRTQR